jgi:hypothetical protein
MIRDLFSGAGLIQYIWLPKWSFIEPREFNITIVSTLRYYCIYVTIVSTLLLHLRYYCIYVIIASTLLLHLRYYCIYVVRRSLTCSYRSSGSIESSRAALYIESVLSLRDRYVIYESDTESAWSVRYLQAILSLRDRYVIYARVEEIIYK